MYPVAFGVVTYLPPSEVFVETGLPAGTNWSVTVDGSSYWSYGVTEIRFQGSSGTYQFQVAAPGFVAAPASGSFRLPRVIGPDNDTTYLDVTFKASPPSPIGAFDIAPLAPIVAGILLASVVAGLAVWTWGRKERAAK